ncbi:MAG: hypothetical protein IMF10_06005 [Proteobacteria bacterium]|nr:hypothetical protein [Pseudomonadota bacterium]
MRLNMIKLLREKKVLRNWEKKGKPVPPPDLVKQKTVKGYARKFSLDTLIETGTYLGDMVDATRDTFGRIFSIELDDALYERARKKFSKFDYISIVQGDSGEVLPVILADIKQPCLFWLDGHYSGGITAKGRLETPISQELYHILAHSVEGHVILIDDARLFTGRDNYPTIEEIQELVFKRHPDWIFEVKNDIIRIHGRAQ